MASISKLTLPSGTIRYECRIKQSRRVIDKRRFKTRKAAQQYALRIEGDKDMLRALGQGGGNITFTDLAEQYLAQYDGKAHSRRSDVRWWIARMGNTAAMAVDVVRLNRELDEYEARPVPVFIGKKDGVAQFKGGADTPKPASINQKRAAVIAVLRYGMSNGYLIDNAGHKVRRRSGDNKRRRYLTTDETAAVLGGAIAQRDSDTSEHNFRVTIISVRIAEAMRLDGQTIRALIRGAFVHDVGKIGIPDAILLKPGRLDEEEFEEMKSHVHRGSEIVSHSQWLTRGSEVVRYHHEKFDGSGYLEGLKGEEIPITARIFAVADVFDACAARRPYKEPFSLERVLEILEEGRGTHFDPQVLDAFGPLAGRLHRELIAEPREEPAGMLQEIARRYYGEVIQELAL